MARSILLARVPIVSLRAKIFFNRHKFPSLKFQEDQHHITIASNLPFPLQELTRTCATPIRFRINGASTFYKNSSDAHTLYLKVDDFQGTIKRLHDTYQWYSLDTLSHPFVPHITLGKFKCSKDAISAASHANLAFQHFGIIYAFQVEHLLQRQ